MLTMKAISHMNNIRFTQIKFTDASSPVDVDILILVEATPCRVEMFHHGPKLISQYSFV